MDPVTVNVAIGNSDDKLTQAQWAEFVRAFQGILHDHSYEIYGVWFSAPDSPYQNACITAAVWPERVDRLRTELIELRAHYQQDSIAWAVVPETEFI